MIEELLLQILNSPHGPAAEALDTSLHTPEGQQEFMNLLTSDNRLAFTYMKMKAKDWSIDTGMLSWINIHKQFFYALIYRCNELNFVLLCYFFEVLYFGSSLWYDFVEYISNCKNERSWQVLNMCFNKFIKCNRSNELYTEIIHAIESLQKVLSDAYFCDNPSQDKNLLCVFYALTYQDIHPFFEDNTDRFFRSFGILFKNKDLHGPLCQIFTLFVSKYSECIDMTSIFGTLLSNTQSFDIQKFTLINNVIRKNKSVLIKFLPLLIEVVQSGAGIFSDEIQEMDIDPLAYTRNILKNCDTHRGIIVEILGHVKMACGEQVRNDLLRINLHSDFDNEKFVFLCLALKIKNKLAEEKAKESVCKVIGYKPLSVICFRYLLFLGLSTEVDFGYLDRTTPACFFAMHYLAKHIGVFTSMDDYRLLTVGMKYVSNTHTEVKKCSFYSVNNRGNVNDNSTGSTLVGSRTGKNKSQLGCFDWPTKTEGYDTMKQASVNYSSLINNLSSFIANNIEDEYSSLLICKVLRQKSEFTTHDFYKFLVGYARANLFNINCPLAYAYIFDSLGLLFINNSSDLAPILTLVQTVMREDLVEIYAPALSLLSLIVLHSNEEFLSLAQIIGMEKLWSSKELLIGMICLTAALYKRSFTTSQHIISIVEYLMNNKQFYYAYLLMNNTPMREWLQYVQKAKNVEDAFTLATALYRNNIIVEEDYMILYKQALDYFTENYIARKNVRRVCRALKVKHSFEVDKIIEKNSENIGYEEAPFSIIIFFDI